MSEILFVGHIGKLIKVAGGVKNTHSKYGDRRMEIMADCLPGTLDEQVRNEWTDRILGLQYHGGGSGILKVLGNL